MILKNVKAVICSFFIIIIFVTGYFIPANQYVNIVGRESAKEIPKRVHSEITEADLLIPALKIIAEQSDGFISTSDLIAALEKALRPQGHDAEIIGGRQDTYFSQKVRNLVSHRNNPNSITSKGYAEHIPDKKGLSITLQGRQFLRTVKELKGLE